ncbi:demethoxyubiquinone hydroxylase family protein [Duganella sp. FT80W]|uniref:Demethoxyubiquinone hydroxylase family protein n=2 Tax=Duganella guangzhouensis TaxID=2666084 RepID=A0A6I2L955_9BURK|nr:demethoxyubiquinone hydroxylase family protein [Duganella guangzhouensis]
MTVSLLSASDYANRVLKVNHAGENGAVNIYRGQIFAARITASDMLDELREFKSHEEKHRAIFWSELQRRERPRCKSYFLCGIGGFFLGLVTGFFGSRAIAATTVTVERVVLGHLEEQLILLRDIDSAAYEAISSIVEEERLHHEQSAAYIKHDQFWPKVLTPFVAGSTEVVIWLGMRL